MGYKTLKYWADRADANLRRAIAAEARVTTLETVNRILSARITKPEEENRTLRDILVQIRKTDRMEKCSVVFEMTYSDALSVKQLETVAAYVFRGLMEADRERRNKHGIQGTD